MIKSNSERIFLIQCNSGCDLKSLLYFAYKSVYSEIDINSHLFIQKIISKHQYRKNLYSLHQHGALVDEYLANHEKKGEIIGRYEVFKRRYESAKSPSIHTGRAAELMAYLISLKPRKVNYVFFKKTVSNIFYSGIDLIVI